MCTKPLIINGYEVSCRECDQCVATYKNSWVARCIAEKQTLPFAYSITLTYADVDGEPPLGARVYRYRDVSNMWKRIRRQGTRRWGKGFELRYVIVGEKGTKLGRCHYHGVVFSNHPIHTLGTLQSAKGGGFAYKRRLEWSVWGHGFVEFQRADRKGMSYALKYILKSRMTAKRSKGFNREGKTEWLASSYLWCSKVPPVGAAWLRNKLHDLYSKGMCPSRLRIDVPGGGEWYVMGKLQEEMCLFLHEANQQFNKERGRDLAGWSTLIKSVEEEIELADTGEMVKRKPWEWLINGATDEEQQPVTAEYIEQQFQQWSNRRELEQSAAFRKKHADKIVARCGNIQPCEKCAERLTGSQQADVDQHYTLAYYDWTQNDRRRFGETPEAYEKRFQRWWRDQGYTSQHCQFSEFNSHRANFELVKALNASRRKAVGAQRS